VRERLATRIDLDTETPLPLQQAAKHRLLRAKSRDGKAINFSTVWRWATGGIRGVRLETVRIGSTLCTTDAAIKRFIDRLSNPELSPTQLTPVDSKRAHRRAAAELEAAGI
jgi:hypothetical protein